MSIGVVEQHLVITQLAQALSRPGLQFANPLNRVHLGTEFGEQGFYRVARSPPQMSLEGGYLGCFEEGCYKSA